MRSGPFNPVRYTVASSNCGIFAARLRAPPRVRRKHRGWTQIAMRARGLLVETTSPTCSGRGVIFMLHPAGICRRGRVAHPHHTNVTEVRGQIRGLQADSDQDACELRLMPSRTCRPALPRRIAHSRNELEVVGELNPREDGEFLLPPSPRTRWQQHERRMHPPGTPLVDEPAGPLPRATTTGPSIRWIEPHTRRCPVEVAPRLCGQCVVFLSNPPSRGDASLRLSRHVYIDAAEAGDRSLHHPLRSQPHI